MKTLRYIGMAILAVILSVNFIACSDDDEDEPQTTPATLAGTTWKIATSDENGMEGATFTFNEDKTVTVNPSMWSKVTYSVNGSNLKIIFNDDDYIEGAIVINGNSATYQYKCYDIDGTVQGDGTQHNMTLQKQ